MSKNYYISACVFTSRYQKVSSLIREYVNDRHGFDIVRCCVPNYKSKEFNEKMRDSYRNRWQDLPHCADFAPGDTVYGICPNCSAIIEETKPAVQARSLWELVLEDKAFPYPDYGGETIAIQDCWRTREKTDLQDAARRLLAKMNFNVVELKENHADTDFCGTSLLRPAPPRNLKLAPVRFVENAKRKSCPTPLKSRKK